MTGDLSKIYMKIGATKAHINFLTRCRKYKLIPKGFRSREHISTRKSCHMEDRFAKIRMREMLNALHAKLFLLDLDIKLVSEKGKKAYTPDILIKAQNRAYYTRMKVMNKKFAQLMSQKTQHNTVRYKTDAVLNLSSKQLSTVQTNVLARGFKFRPTLRTIPIQDIIIGIESLIKTAKLSTETATNLRNTTIKEIDRMERRENRNPTKQNLSKREWSAITSLAAERDRRIIPADKGDKSIVMDYRWEILDNEEDTTVILNEESYLAKLKDRITQHIHIDDDPAPVHERKLNAAIRKIIQAGKQMPTRDKDNPIEFILSRDKISQYITEGAIAPTLKGQLKDHKDTKPLREVSNASQSPGHELAKVLNKLFEPYTGQTKTAITGGKQLIKVIREGRFEGNFLSSCDAIALYPSIVVEEGLQLLEDKIIEDNSLKTKTD